MAHFSIMMGILNRTPSDLNEITFKVDADSLTVTDMASVDGAVHSMSQALKKCNFTKMKITRPGEISFSIKQFRVS